MRLPRLSWVLFDIIQSTADFHLLAYTPVSFSKFAIMTSCEPMVSEWRNCKIVSVSTMQSCSWYQESGKPVARGKTHFCVPHRHVLYAVRWSVCVSEAPGVIPSLELPLGHAGVGIRSGELDRLLDRAIPPGSPEFVVPPEKCWMVLFVACQSSVEQRAVRISSRLASLIGTEIGDIGDPIPVWQREFGEGTADDQGEAREYCDEEPHRGTFGLID